MLSAHRADFFLVKTLHGADGFEGDAEDDLLLLLIWLSREARPLRPSPERRAARSPERWPARSKTLIAEWWGDAERPAALRCGQEGRPKKPMSQIVLLCMRRPTAGAEGLL